MHRQNYNRRTKFSKLTSLTLLLVVSLSIAMLSTIVQPAKATLAFSSGFEDNFASWSSTNGNAAIVSSPVYGGAKAASFRSASGGDQNCVIKDLGSDYSHLYISGWFNFPVLPTTVPYDLSALVGLKSSSWQNAAGYFKLAYNPVSQKYSFGLLNPATSSYVQSADMALLPNTWYYLTIEVGAGQSGLLNLWINKVGTQPTQIISFSGNTGSALIRYVFIGMDYTWNLRGLSGGFSVYLDDVSISDSSPTSSSTSPPVSSLKVGIYGDSWNFAEYSASTIASTFDITQSRWISPSDTYSQYGAKMNQVLAINPNYKPLVYRNVQAIYSYWTDEWNYAKDQRWLLKDAYGNYVAGAEGFSTEYQVDITNPSYQTWVANKIQSWLVQYPFFAGVMVDGGLKYSVGDWTGSANTPINPRTGAPFTTQQILDGCVGTINAITNAVGSSKLVVANGMWSGFLLKDAVAGPNYKYVLSRTPNLSGINSEGLFYQSYTTNFWPTDWWQQSVDMTAWIQDNFLSAGSNRQFIAMDPVENPPIPAGIAPKDLAMFGFCSLMLGVKYSGQNNFCLGDLSRDSAMVAFAQQLRGLNLGALGGSYYSVGSGSGTLYVRDFQAGRVVVNPSSTPLSYVTGGSYKYMDGSSVAGTITVNSHNGVVLLK